MHRWAHKRIQVELTQTQMNPVERMHADVERRILLTLEYPRVVLLESLIIPHNI